MTASQYATIHNDLTVIILLLVSILAFTVTILISSRRR